MDAIKRPLKIPPEFGRYAEEKGVFQLYERLLSALLMHRPEEPLQFLAEYLSRGREDGECENSLDSSGHCRSFDVCHSTSSYHLWATCFRPAHDCEFTLCVCPPTTSVATGFTDA